VKVLGSSCGCEPRGRRRAGGAVALVLVGVVGLVGASSVRAQTTSAQDVQTTAYPSTVSVVNGSVVSGGASQLSSRDGSFFQVASTTGKSPQAAWYGSVVGLPGDVTQLQIDYSGLNSSPCSQKISIWNWSTSKWSTLDTETVGTTEVDIDDLVPSGDVSKYVNQGQVNVEVTNSCTPAFTTSADLLSVTYSEPSLGSEVSAWHMDETSGTTMVDSVGGNNGMLSDVTLGEPGIAGTAYGFNGQDSIVTVPDSPSLDPGNADFSFTISAQMTVVPATDYDLFRKGLNTTDGGDYKLEAVSAQNGTIAQAHCVFEGSENTGQITAGPNLADGQWHTLTCWKNATAIGVIVDGQSFWHSVTVGSIGSSAPLTIGAKLKGTLAKDQFDGTLDEASFSVAQ
jgi:hypothetical protein